MGSYNNYFDMAKGFFETYKDRVKNCDDELWMEIVSMGKFFGSSRLAMDLFCATLEELERLGKDGAE